MKKQFLSEAFFTFFKKLAANNRREWFDENRRTYEKEVKLPFENLVDALLFEMAKLDKSYANIKGKDCIFRINRDVRFAKDKSPYKLNRSAIISPGGKKDLNPTGFYFEIGPEECAFYAGVYLPDTETIKNIREYIAKKNDQFEQIIRAISFKKIFVEVQGERQKRVDSSLKMAAEIQPILYNKQFYIKHIFSEKKVNSSGLVEYLLQVHQAATPFCNFMEKAMKSDKK